MSAFPRYADATTTISTPALRLFGFLDDHNNLSSHMREPSLMMLGSRMDAYLDRARTRAVGSRFGFKGAILGIPLWVDEIVTERELPRRKAWETTGEPGLWVIGRYRMGFEITPVSSGARLRVYIEYALPERGLPRLLGTLFGGMYAHWCTRRMVDDAKHHFAELRAIASAA